MPISRQAKQKKEIQEIIPHARLSRLLKITLASILKTWPLSAFLLAALQKTTLTLHLISFFSIKNAVKLSLLTDKRR
jgi:hypothetical protein